ncbi:MAG: OmpA family protein, partial [Eubacterium sp.]|nr:OmpA family protein [Eubacterium sp.]
DDNKTGDNIDKATVEAVEQQLEEEQKERNLKTYEEIIAAAEARNIQDDITVQMDKKNQYVQITMNGALLFESGKATLKQSVIPILSKVGNILQLYKGNRIQILGHTDAVPISSSEFPNNLWLSMARATSVFEYLTEVKKLEAHNLETTGRGEYDPVASNGTEEGRAKNRRVEFRIYTNK